MDDAWTATSRASDDPPARLSSAGQLEVLAEAIERGRRSGGLTVLREAVRWPGYRRGLLGRFAGWTREERRIDGAPPGDSAVELEEWSLFGHYRATLRQIHAEDPEGWAAWASERLLSRPPPELRKPGHVVVIDPLAPGLPGWRLLESCHRQSRSMTVILPFEADPALAELYASVEPVRGKLLGWGFVEESDHADLFSGRPRGLDAVERDLFRSDSHARPRLSVAADQGLKILGGPRGEGVGLLIAREVRDHLDRGIPPEDVAILVPRLDEDAERIRDVLTSWDLPVDPSGERRLSTLGAVSTLRLAMGLPVGGWDVATLVRLLRNGLVGWPELDAISPFARFEAASALQATRVFRDRRAIRDALERASEDEKADQRPAKWAIRALDRISAMLDEAAAPGPWRVQVGRARRLADALGLEPDVLQPLWDALDDLGWVRDALGPAISEESWSWAEFVARVGSTVSEAPTTRGPAEPGTIRIEAIGSAEGARAEVVILANLAERTLPSPEAVELDPEAPADRPNLAYSREMLRFARVAGSAGRSLILAFPTTDEKGEELLPAGFLDDLIRRLDPASAAACVERHARFDAVLADQPGLARSPNDARVLAVAGACRDGSLSPLRRLAASAEHAGPLRGAADAFEVAQIRREIRAFGPYDGRLLDPRAIARIREEFGPDHAFSPSQLESFALCPFQFFQRYVLGLKVVDERQELDEDYAGRGSDVHRVLEQIHQQASAEGDPNLIDRLTVLIATEMRVELERHESSAADVPHVLKEIGARRTNKALGRYIAQYQSYARKSDVLPEPHRFEVGFGQEEGSHPCLTIGEGEGSVKLQGKIDRIDLIRKGGKVAFRVIDYKTGSNPSGKDVLSGLASQLPLYALAVENLVFTEGDFSFEDAGYWSLPKDGFKSVKLGDWPAYRERLTAFVLATVAALRKGSFPIESQKKECRKYCDFHAACRVGEVRLVGKIWDGRPRLEDGA